MERGDQERKRHKNKMSKNNKMSEEYNALYYRADQYKSLEQAQKAQAVWRWEVTYGYSATADAIVNAKHMLLAVDGNYQQIKIRWNVDGVNLKECYLVDSVEVLGEYEREETK